MFGINLNKVSKKIVKAKHSYSLVTPGLRELTPVKYTKFIKILNLFSLIKNLNLKLIQTRQISK